MPRPHRPFEVLATGLGWAPHGCGGWSASNGSEAVGARWESMATPWTAFEFVGTVRLVFTKPGQLKRQA
jgi:hypothetical protein